MREAGERAWLLEWKGDESVANAQARAAAAALRAANPAGLLDAVPAARSCLVLGGPLFDPSALPALEADPPAAPPGPAPQTHEIRFTPDGVDLDEIASRCALTPGRFPARSRAPRTRWGSWLHAGRVSLRPPSR